MSEAVVRLQADPGQPTAYVMGGAVDILTPPQHGDVEERDVWPTLVHD